MEVHHVVEDKKVEMPGCYDTFDYEIAHKKKEDAKRIKTMIK